jgi:hypothetical protein
MSTKNEDEPKMPAVALREGHYLITMFEEVYPEAEEDGWLIESERPLGIFEFSGHSHSEKVLIGFVCRCLKGLIVPEDIGQVVVDQGADTYCLCAHNGRPLLEISLH